MSCRKEARCKIYCLSSITICFLFLLSYAIFPPRHAFSGEGNVMRIEAMGSVPVSVDTAKPDDLAIEDAFRRAVAKAVEAIVPKKEFYTLALILDDKIYNNAARYVLNYRVLSKEVMEDESPVAEGGIQVFNAYIEANISIDLLTKDLIEAGVLREVEVSEVGVTILNLRTYKDFDFLKKSIKGLKGVKDVHYRSFARDKVELVVKIGGDAEVLMEELMYIYMKEWIMETRIISGWFSPARIEIKLLPLKEEVIVQ